MDRGLSGRFASPFRHALAFTPPPRPPPLSVFASEDPDICAAFSVAFRNRRAAQGFIGFTVLARLVKVLPSHPCG